MTTIYDAAILLVDDNPDLLTLVTDNLRHLREKIEPDPGHPQWLLTVRGIGYRLTGEV